MEVPGAVQQPDVLFTCNGIHTPVRARGRCGTAWQRSQGILLLYSIPVGNTLIGTHDSRDRSGGTHADCEDPERRVLPELPVRHASLVVKDVLKT